MVRILLANEGGSGRGHILTLRSVAEALGGAFTFEAALYRLDYAALLAPLCDFVFPSAGLHYKSEHRRGPGAVRTSTWGEFLADLGFSDAAFLRRQIGWWRECLVARRIDLLVGEYAPCAHLAARSLGVPSVQVGTGYGLPPDHLREFPVLLPQYSERLYPEETLVQNVNKALSYYCDVRIQYLPEMYAEAIRLPRTLRELDPYRGLRIEGHVPPMTTLSEVKAADGDEVFCYITNLTDSPIALTDALSRVDVPLRAYLPDAPEETLQHLGRAGVMVERSPLPADNIIRQTRLLLHVGQHGSLCMGLAAGIPQVALPQHLEHLYHASAAAAFGCVQVLHPARMTAGQIAEAIEHACADAALTAAARDTAAVVGHPIREDAAAIMRERLRPMLGSILSSKADTAGWAL